MPKPTNKITKEMKDDIRLLIAELKAQKNQPDDADIPGGWEMWAPVIEARRNLRSKKDAN